MEALERRIERLSAEVRRAVAGGDRDRASALRAELRLSGADPADAAQALARLAARQLTDAAAVHRLNPHRRPPHAATGDFNIRTTDFPARTRWTTAGGLVPAPPTRAPRNPQALVSGVLAS